jgi:hypothetical protein
MGAPLKRALVAVALEQNKPEEMFGRDKSEGKIGRLGQTFLPFAIHFSNKKRDRSLSWGKHDR